MNLASLLFNAARSFPDCKAVSRGGELLYRYGEYAALAGRLAGALATAGLRRGDRVGLAMSNHPDYLALLFGIWRAGMVAVPVNARLHPRELAYIFADCAAPLCIATPDIADSLAPVLPPGTRLVVTGEADWRRLAGSEPAAMADRDAADPAWIFYTSGTTGRPKGAILTQRNLMAMTLAYLADVDHLSPDDIFLHLTAQSHAVGLFGLSHIAKASHQVLPESGGFDPSEVASLIQLYRNVTLFVPPTGLRRLLQDDDFRAVPVEHVRTLLLGAAPVYAADLKAGNAQLGPRLWNGYGQGESPCTITAMSKEMLATAIAAGNEARMMSVGIARTGIELAILDEAGRAVPTGEIGEVAVRGETVMAGYWNQLEATAETLRGGWLHTGDLGALDDAGYLALLDRAKDLVISGGLNIYPREIEEVLLDHPDVAEAAVIGVPDVEWGESVMAVLVARPGRRLDTAGLEQACLDRIARFKRPRHWRIVAALPKNQAGKVLKRELKARYAAEIKSGA